MSGVQHVEVKPSEADMRLDRWFKAHFPKLGHGKLEQLLRKGLVRVDGARAKTNARLSAGQVIRIPPEANVAKTANRGPRVPRFDQRTATALTDTILLRDPRILVINKPSGLAVQGGSKTTAHVDGALPGLRFDAEETPRLVHRLDRDTSGVLVLARDRLAATALTRAFASRDTEKTYWALVHGVPRPHMGVVDMPLIKQMARDGGERVRPAQKGEPGALRARTAFALVARAAQKFSWVAFRPITGRTHQIRAHAAAIGHPIAGDGKYMRGGDGFDLGGELPKKLHLHARSILMPHPNGGIFHVEAPLTGHMAESWRLLGLDQDRDLMTRDPFEE